MTKQKVAFATLQTRQRSGGVSLLYNVIAVRDITRYYTILHDISWGRAMYQDRVNSTEISNILQNALSQVILPKQLKITPLSATCPLG
jgi:phosphoribosylformimino-5-aminoimidazole carboxamide ribonucleotide (ProFAR) isomerase